MMTAIILSFGIPLILTLVAPGLRWGLAIAAVLAAVIGWQDFAFWEAANSPPDFVGPPALPIGRGAVNVSAAGLAIGTLTRGIQFGLQAMKVSVGWPAFLLIFGLVSLGVGAVYALGFFRF